MHYVMAINHVKGNWLETSVEEPLMRLYRRFLQIGEAKNKTGNTTRRKHSWYSAIPVPRSEGDGQEYAVRWTSYLLSKMDRNKRDGN